MAPWRLTLAKTVLRSAVVSIVTVLVSPLLTIGAATADDHRPPRVVLHVADDPLQQGQLGASCWTRRGDVGEVITECNGAVWDFPEAVRANAGERARIRIKKTQPPQYLEIRAWRRVNGAEEPIGDGRTVDFQLRPHVDAASDEIAAYDAVFSLRARKGHLYIKLSGIWKDEDAAAGDQDASWTLHVNLR